MFNITYQRNANKNHSEIQPHACENGLKFLKKLETVNADKELGKKKPS